MIVLMTDFGLKDPYVGIMKGVIKKISPSSEIIDLTHEIPPQNIATGHFMLRHSYKHFPDKTVFVSVVDPGVGTLRRAISIKTDKHYFVGPDNGLFGFLHDERFGDKQVIHLTNTRYFYKMKPDRTFHGRDIFAPIAAHIDSGVMFSELGTPVEGFASFKMTECITKGDEIRIPLLHIDRFGNLIFSMTRDELEERLKGKNFTIEIGDCKIDRISENYDEDSALIALFNSYGLLEIAAPSQSAAKILGLSVGEDSAPVYLKLRVSREAGGQTPMRRKMSNVET